MQKTRTIALTLLLAGGAGMMLSPAPTHARQSADPFARLPSSITLTGVARDFRERGVTNGHPDFERQPTGGFGVYNRMVQDDLGSDGAPVFRSTGQRVTGWATDRQGRRIIGSKSYITARQGDTDVTLSTTATGALTTQQNFDQWYRDVNGTNVRIEVPLNLTRIPNTNRFVFDDRLDPSFSAMGGFWPINNQGFGNSANDNKNFHFTFEINSSFIYEAGAGQTFTFAGDDDIWVFIDGKLVIDLGGVHGREEQTIEADRLGWLVGGRRYSLKIFFAERHRTGSNCRIETTLNLQSEAVPPRLTGWREQEPR
ncbi:MAG: fibro-slime domain-containing protein [Phycisphaerales bacterium]|nr:fibro-slime domain-containing protein [Phycisphaerales bacterium]